MFGNRRKRAPSNPTLNRSNANPAATTAATSAFLKNQASNASLSSAAAAAALRARPTTPISVADVQTKRTLRRTGSTSSMGSSVNGSQRGGAPPLERRGSSGSMTERTFRDPSPARGVPSAPDAPPVPAIPQNMQSAVSKPHRRAASLEAAPMRVASPPPNQGPGRGSSLGPGITTTPRRPAQKMSNLSSVSELTSVESRGSVNFSYPTSSRPTSPLAQRRLTSTSPSRNIPRIASPTNQNLVYDPNTRSFLPAAEVYAIGQRIYEAANKPVKKMKRVPPGNATGSHFADGTVGGRPKGTAIDAMEAAAHHTTHPVVQKPVEQPKLAPAPISELSAEPAPATLPTTVPKLKKRKKVVMSDSESDRASYVPNSSDNDSDVPMFDNRAGVLLAKKPSIVREDREREEEEDDTPKIEKPSDLIVDTSAAGRNISPSPLTRSMAGRGHGKGQAAASATFAQDKQQTRSASQPAPSVQDVAPVTEGPSLSANASVRGARVQSVSPGRSAHFATTPDSLAVKHQPPPRSISPRKSALKHTNSRTSSPIPGPGAGSEASNSSAAPDEQISVPRKKANRVSFDETNVAVGQAAAPISSDSPIVQSPQTGKRPWYSIGRGKKKDVAIMDDEEDEIMKPRPALPSFGSARERKNRDVEERPLVKPAEPIEFKPAAPSPLFTSPTGEVIENPLGQSNDHAVGAILAQDSTTKNAANISKSREPLPPQVLSVEGNGDLSDTESSVSGTENNTPTTAVTEPEVVEQPIEQEAVDTAKVVGEDPSSDRDEDMPIPPRENPVNGDVPEIAVSQPTPTLEDTNSRKEWPNIPGGWESSTSDSGSNETPRVSSEELMEVTPAAVGIAEPTPDIQVHGSPKIEAENLYTTSAIMEETEESEADVYSDAAEEMTDGEGDGFQSLNAVVESPITSSVPGLAISTPPDSPTTKVVKERAYKKSGLSKKSSEPDLDEGWDKAQEYWKSLSSDKKRQLELEAMQEAEDGSDTEVEVKPAPKPKKKKKAVKPASAPAAVSNERTYMIQPGSKAGPGGHTTMRSSMRAEPASPSGDTQMRKSMRAQDPGLGQGTMRSSMRGPQLESGGSQKKNRPVSLPAEKVNPAINKHARNLSSASAAAAQGAANRDMQPPVPTLRRKGSGDSDSSFKRAKPSNEMNLRRSMRGNQAPSPLERPQSPSSRFSIRSLSPTGSMLRRPFSNTPAPQNSSTQNHMRMSMRGNQDPTATLRGSASKRGKSPSGGMKMPGFGRSSKPAKTQKPVRARTSRFADSSDEDDERPDFRSRFVDSSDDSDHEPVQRSTTMPRSMRTPAPAPSYSDTVETAAPIRGIPKRAGIEDGDSSDLPDSDDEKATSPNSKLHKKKGGQNGTAGKTLASGSLRRSGSGAGTLTSPKNITTITAPPMRPAHKRRESIMSILRRKKDSTSKVRKSDAESPARRDTPLERSKSDLAALRSSGDRPTTPKLQKRRTLSRGNSGLNEKDKEWPLKIGDSAPRILGGEDGRPFTADAGDGVVGAESAAINGNGKGEEGRPDIGTRRFTATGLSSVDGKVVNGVNGEGRKKKKFGKLRRMFGLDE